MTPAGKDIANAAAERAAKALGPGKSLAEQNIEAGIKGWAQMGVDISEAGTALDPADPLRTRIADAMERCREEMGACSNMRRYHLAVKYGQLSALLRCRDRVLADGAGNCTASTTDDGKASGMNEQ